MKYYAEYLSNINFVGVYFDSDSADSTLAADKGSTTSQISFSDGRSETLALPAAVRESATAVPPQATSVRLSVLHALNVPQRNEKLPPTCLCGQPLVGQNVRWKRLPSEHWAELMDLWHCHKPSEPSKNGESLYDLAMNGFHARPGQAFYSDTYFLVHIEDIARAEHSSDCDLVRQRLAAGDSGDSIKLWKWDLDKGPVGPVIADIFAELVDAHAVYTFEINSELLVWVFNPSVMYTVTGAKAPVRGCKVLYGPAETLRQQRPDPEIVDLPAPVYTKFASELATLNGKLPAGLQKMGHWNLAVI